MLTELEDVDRPTGRHRDVTAATPRQVAAADELATATTMWTPLPQWPEEAGGVDDAEFGAVLHTAFDESAAAQDPSTSAPTPAPSSEPSAMTGLEAAWAAVRDRQHAADLKGLILAQMALELVDSAARLGRS